MLPGELYFSSTNLKIWSGSYTRLPRLFSSLVMGLSLGLLLNGALGYEINYKGRNHHRD
jgi:hypothetical protein